MKKSFLKFFSQVLILSLVLSTACTHKRDSLLGENELSSGGVESSMDITSQSDTVAEMPSESTSSESTEATPPASDLSSFSSDSGGSGATPSEDLSSSTPVEQSSPSADLTTSESNDLSTLSGDLAAPSTQPELVIPPAAETAEVTIPQTDALSSESLGGSLPESSNVLPDATVASNPDTLPAPAPEEVAAPVSAPEVKAAAPVVTAKALTIPTQAISKAGANLNRYYFARSGDSADSLSQLFYGSTDNSKEIAKWNGKSFKAGSLVYFVSADQPDDSEMSSFYEEQGISTDTYTVKAGDQLSTIAQNKYGNVQSWKEIASLNHLTNPDHISPGQQLTLLPTQMTSIHAKPAAVTAQLPPAQVKAAEPEVKVLTEDDQEELAFAQVEKEEIAGQKLPAPGSQMEKNKETHMAALEVAQPDGSSFTALALGGGFAALALFMFLVRRARTRARAEFME